MKPAFLDHLVIVVKNIEETERFYNTFLGQPTEKTNDQIIYEIDNIKLFFVSPLESWQSFNKDAGGLNHLAFGIKTKEELENFKDILDTNKIKNSGIQIDKYEQKEFIWFDDPNNIRLEFYLR